MVILMGDAEYISAKDTFQVAASLFEAEKRLIKAYGAGPDIQTAQIAAVDAAFKLLEWAKTGHKPEMNLAPHGTAVSAANDEEMAHEPTAKRTRRAPRTVAPKVADEAKPDAEDTSDKAVAPFVAAVIDAPIPVIPEEIIAGPAAEEEIAEEAASEIPPMGMPVETAAMVEDIEAEAALEKAAEASEPVSEPVPEIEAVAPIEDANAARQNALQYIFRTGKHKGKTIGMVLAAGGQRDLKWYAANADNAILRRCASLALNQ